MRKLFLMIFSITLIAINSMAQGDRSKLAFGMKIGLNMSNVYDSKGEDFNADSKIGFAGGVFLAVPIGDYFGIQPELLYSQKGYKTSGSVLGYDYSLTRTSDFIDVPILFALKPSPFVTVLLGPQYSYLVKQKDVFDNPISNVIVEQEFNTNNLRKNILGFIGGVDVNISDFVIGARVSWDLTDNNGDGTSTIPRYKNVLGQLTLGYRFN